MNMGYGKIIGLAITVLGWLNVIYGEKDTTLAQSPTNGMDHQYIHDAWGTENGLPQNSVTALIQSRDGYLWVGTFGSLARFDGMKFTIFDTGNTPSLKSNRILSLYEDRAGNLWIGTDGGGVTKYIRNGFTTYTRKDGLPDDVVSSIGEDGEGNLWLATHNGLVRFTSGRFTTYTTEQGLPTNRVSTIRRGADGSLWFQSDRGVTRYHGGRFTNYTDFGDPVASGFDLHTGRDGSVWFNTTAEPFRFDGARFTLVPTDSLGPARPGARTPVVRFYTDREGNMRFLTFTGTAQVKDGKIVADRHIAELSALIDNVAQVRSVIEDREGNLWIGTSGKGLHRFKEAQVTAYAAEDGLSESGFVPITDDGEGGLWLGSESGGLFRFRQGTFIRDPIRLGPWAIWRARDGSLWIGEYGGLYRYEKGRLTRYDRFDQIPVMSIYEDREGAVWIGTLRSHAPGNLGGLYRYKEGEFALYRTSEGLVHNEVHFITEDRQGALWIGTEGGLSRFKDGQFTNYTTENGLSHNYVRDVYEDADGRVWIGTYGGGLNRFKDGTFARITTKEGLFDNVVSRILEDDQGHLWMSCNRGIFRASRKELNELAEGKVRSITCVSYGVADGMESSECNGGGQPAGWKTPDGRLWFPTVKGVVAVDPKRTNPLAPLVVVEEMLAGKSRVAFWNEVELPPSQRDLEIHYTGLSFAAPEKVRFRYRLEGYDADWIEAGTRRVAFYTNIPAGHYRFRVIACNNDGLWNEAGATVEFSLQPHFYETLYFYGLLIVLLLLVGRGAHALRVRQLEERNRQLAAKVAERTAEVVEQKNQLAEANDNMLAMLNQLQIGVAMSDPDGRVTFFSRAAERLFGQHQEEILNQPWEKLFPLQEQDRARLKALYHNPQPARVSFQVQSSTGQRFWIEIEASEDPRDPRQRIFFLYDVSQVYDLRRLLDEKAKFHDLVGQSKVMLLVYQQIQDLAQVDSTVLIEGETGTGKELVARAIHYASPRRTKPFVAVNCAGLTESLLTSQLFGHKRGAFTGAVADQVGVFEAAGGGTLFLDEIGDIPTSVQTSLLRVLQEKEITRLGESKPRQIDVRLIAATNRELSQEVAAGRFREDLLYRIRVTRIHLPPLRERREDIPLLVAWFLGQFRAAKEKSVHDVSQDAMQTLIAYSWPGNIRELKSAIESAVVHCKGPMIQVTDLPPELTGTSARLMPIGGLMQDEKQRILDALERTGGNRKAAARLLGMGRSTLYRKLEELGIKPE